jgi:hypothetical protein
MTVQASAELSSTWGLHRLGRHNPLYAFSALCIIAGVYLVGRELEDTALGRALLAGVLELYAALLIAGAAALRRVQQARGAASLGLLAAFFLFDPTLRVEGLVTSDAIAVGALGLWCVLALAKLELLARVFELRQRGRAMVPLVVSLLSIACVPWLARAMPAQRELLAVNLGFVGALLIFTTVRWPAQATQPGDASLLGRRCLQAVQWLAVLGYHAHVATTLHAHEVPLRLLMFVPYLALLPALAKRERSVWQLAATALLLASTSLITLAPTALLVCAALLAQHLRLGTPQLLTGAVVAAYLGIWVHGAHSYAALQAPGLALQLVGATLLLGIAYRHRLWSALPVAAACLGPSLRSGSGEPLHLGVLVLVAGFAALALGIWRDAHLEQP